MANFVAPVAEATRQQMIALANGVNAALRGDTANIGHIDCAANAASVTVSDRRCRAGRLAILIPLDANAATARWYLDTMTRDSMTFRFTTPPSGSCRFGWALIGDGRED